MRFFGSYGTVWNPYCWKCLSKVKAVDIASCSINAKLVQSVKLKSLSLYFLKIFQAVFSVSRVTLSILRIFEHFMFSSNATATWWLNFNLNRVNTSFNM